MFRKNETRRNVKSRISSAAKSNTVESELTEDLIQVNEKSSLQAVRDTQFYDLHRQSFSQEFRKL